MLKNESIPEPGCKCENDPRQHAASAMHNIQAWKDQYGFTVLCALVRCVGKRMWLHLLKQKSNLSHANFFTLKQNSKAQRICLRKLRKLHKLRNVKHLYIWNVASLNALRDSRTTQATLPFLQKNKNRHPVSPYKLYSKNPFGQERTHFRCFLVTQFCMDIAKNKIARGRHFLFRRRFTHLTGDTFPE